MPSTKVPGSSELRRRSAKQAGHTVRVYSSIRYERAAKPAIGAASVRAGFALQRQTLVWMPTFTLGCELEPWIQQSGRVLASWPKRDSVALLAEMDGRRA